MSASTDRKKRLEAITNGTDRKTQAQLEEIKNKKKSKMRWTFGTIVVVLLIAAILILNSNLFYTGTTAVQIGDEEYSAAQFNYYFKNQYYNFVQQYGDYISYIGLDTQSPLKNQKCNMIEDGTWYDYFKQQAISMMTQVTAMSKYAAENGITLDDADQADIDSTMADFASGATSNNYSSTKNYLTALFGRGCDEKLVRGELERSALASKAYNSVLNEYESGLTAEELEANYTENKDSYDVFNYDYYLVNAETVVASDTAAEAADTDTDSAAEPEAAVTDETMAAAKVTADAIAAKAKTGSFADAVTSAVADASASEQKNVSGSSISGDYAEWLKSADRHAGDVTVVESADTGYYVVKFNSRSNNHYGMAQVRHILIKAVAAEDGTYTDEAKAAAKEKAQEIYDQWLAGDKTEASFASLAATNSEDTGSNTNGGLYDSIYKGQMVDEFDAFCFAAGRKAGDTGIVYGETTSYCGYHVMYYVGTGDLYSSYLAKNSMDSTYMNTWSTDLMANYSSTEKFSIRFAG